MKKDEKKKQQAQIIYQRLVETFPNAHCELIHTNPFELLIATILSAQCTDKQVNKVTPNLFKKYPDPKSLSDAPIEEIEKIIQSTGFYKNKAKNIKACSLVLFEQYQNSVPDKMDQLTQLNGVGRKTANVVLGNAFNINVGVVVDTHVSRISQKLKLTKNKTPEKIEEDLMKLFENHQWTQLSHLLIFLGRSFCKARSPECEKCPMNDLCPSSN